MLLLLALLACQNSDDAGDRAIHQAQMWPGEDVRPPLTHAFFDAHPMDLSLYATRVEGPIDGRPDFAHRGMFAMGNGRAFGFLGLTDPINTLHEMIGPVYRQDDGFFGDQHTELWVDGVEAVFDVEYAARVRGTSVVVTRAESVDHVLTTVDFAPLPAGMAANEVPTALIRIVLVEAERAGEIEIRQVPHIGFEDVNGRIAEPRSDRSLVVSGLDINPVLDGQTAVFSLGNLGAGESTSMTMAVGFAWDEAGQDALAVVLDGADAEVWLDDTLDWWRAFSAKGMQLKVDDPRIEDMLDGMRCSIRVQQSDAGGVGPMSRYTGVWLRDHMGPVRLFTRVGLFDEAEAAVDYLHLCHIDRGDYGNACKSGLTPADVGAEPDWDALPDFSDRTAAEGPSYVPLLYKELERWTGDTRRADERWSYLRRAVLAQQMDDLGRQTFSGDETFRLTMGAAMGFPLEYDWQGLAWSANSAFLLEASADYLADVADERHPEDSVALRDRANLARTALDFFKLPEGHHAPFIFHTEGNDNTADYVETRPFEDVNLKPTWLGNSANDGAALVELDAMVAAAGQGDGTVQTPMQGGLDGFELQVSVEEGIATGMVPGYYLYSLTALGHEQAADAFNAVHRYASTSGQFQEDMVYSDFSALHVFYDPTGFLGDVGSRYRPWEGGVVVDAMMFYLIGADPQPDGLHLSPHLPNGLPTLDAGPIHVGDSAVDLHLERVGLDLKATLTSTGTQPITVHLSLPDAKGEARPGGERWTSFEAVTLAPGQVQTFEI